MSCMKNLHNWNVESESFTIAHLIMIPNLNVLDSIFDSILIVLSKLLIRRNKVNYPYFRGPVSKGIESSINNK